MTRLLWEGVIWEGSPWVYLGLTVILGGAAAYLTGRAVALRWRSAWQAVVYALLLAAALRFLHFAIFSGTLLSVRYYAVDLIIVLVAALLGYRLTRVGQMVTQYRWLYRRSGAFAWAPAGGSDSGETAAR